MMDQKEQAFRIIYNFRKNKGKKRHQVKIIPPSSIQTRHMSSLAQEKSHEEFYQCELIEEPNYQSQGDIYDEILRDQEHQIQCCELPLPTRNQHEGDYDNYNAYASTRMTQIFQNQ